jgi:type IV pilus assembly protein PilE
MRSSKQGFTLIEVMITVAVIGILAAIGYPAYQDQLLRAKRAEGKTALLKAQQLQERNYLNGDPTPLVATPNPVPTYLTTAKLAVLFGLAEGAVIYSGESPAVASGAYTISVDPVPGGTCTTTLLDCFVLRATPNNAAPANFTDIRDGAVQCGQLTLDSVGARGGGLSTTGTRTAAECWAR